MRIGLCGPGGGGKSTLLSALREHEEFANIELLPEITRLIRQDGFPINEAGNGDTQILVMNSHMHNLLMKDNFIVDRCLVDGAVYTAYLSNERKIKPMISAWADFLFDEYVGRYDFIFYIPNEFPVKADGVRSVDTVFNAEIRELFSVYTDRVEWITRDRPNLVTLSGSVEDRVDQVINAMRRKNG